MCKDEPPFPMLRNLGDQPLVSVVVPCFNSIEFIDETLASVVSQTYQNLEVIVVNDGSTDGVAPHIALRYEDPRVAVYSFENEGLGESRNRGIRLAEGKYLAFLDADDVWNPNKLSLQVAALEKSDAIAICGRVTYISRDSKRRRGIAGFDTRTSDAHERVKMAKLMPCPISFILFRTAAVKEAGDFDNVPGVEDLDFLRRVAALGQLDFRPEIVGAYRVHPSSMTAKKHSEQRDATRFVQARAAGLFSETTPYSTLGEIKVSRQDRAAITFRRAAVCWLNGQYGRTITAAVRSLATDPRYFVGRLALRLGRNRAP